MTTPPRVGVEALIARLEAAPDGSRELDARVAFAIRWRPQSPELSRQSFAEHEDKHDYATAWIAHAPWRNTWNIPTYTTSIDAALTLAPKDWCGRLCWDSKSAQAEYVTTDGDELELGDAVTPALALCIAALKARLA